MIKQQIFRLDVPMDHILLMTIRQRLRETQNVLKFTREIHKDLSQMIQLKTHSLGVLNFTKNKELNPKKKKNPYN